MKFNNWKLNSLINYLESLKSSELFDSACIIRVSGEIQCFNGERKDGTPKGDLFENTPTLSDTLGRKNHEQYKKTPS